MNNRAFDNIRYSYPVHSSRGFTSQKTRCLSVIESGRTQLHFKKEIFIIELAGTLNWHFEVWANFW